MTSRSESIIEIEDDDENSFEIKAGKPRNIVFCIDMSVEVNEELGPSANGGVKQSSLYSSSRLETVQRFIGRYAAMNTAIGNIHDKYGIITLKNKATWWYGCDADVESLKDELNFLDSQVTHRCTKLYTSSIFNEIKSHLDLNDNNYFTQAIVFYVRTNVKPTHPIQREDYGDVRDSSNFTMDLIYMHDQDNSENVQSVYDEWLNLDSTINPGWFYETGVVRGKDRIAKALSELLAHPLQRPDQDSSEMGRVMPSIL